MWLQGAWRAVRRRGPPPACVRAAAATRLASASSAAAAQAEHVLTGSNFVGGELSRAGADTYAALSPLGQHVLPCEFHNATAAEISDAVGAAARAFRAYRRQEPTARAAFLRQIGAEIEALGEALIERAHEETGLPLPRLRNERARTVDQLGKFAGFIEEGSWVHGLSVVGGGVNIRRMQVPVGPVTVFGASNFPLAFSVAGGDTAAALAAGCPVVVKVHPSHPGTSELVASAIRRAVGKCAGVPAGVFSMLHGTTPAIAGDIVTRPEIKAVGFTGSIAAGRALFDLCAARPEPIPVFAEMGSVNPVVLLPSALEQRFDAVVNGLAGSLTLGAGQFCTKPGVVFVVDNANCDASATEKFKDALVRAVENIPAQSMLTPGILAGFKAQTAKSAAVEGVETLTRARAVDERQTEVAGVVQAVRGRDFLAHHDVLAEEAFGPFALVVVCKDEDELLDALEVLHGQLTATVWGLPETSDEFTETLLDVLSDRAGRVISCGWPTGVEVCGAMNHGGPYPASSIDSTSVGTQALYRFVRAVCFQDVASAHLPAELRDSNPRGIVRSVNGHLSDGAVDTSTYTTL